MKKLNSFKQYILLLFSTYKLFFKAAKFITVIVVLLAPIQALASVIAVSSAQDVVSQVSNHQNYIHEIIIWIIATALTQLLPPIATSVQGILTDKLTGYINLSLMKKSQEFQFLTIFDDSNYYDDLKMVKDDAMWRPTNLIVFGVAILQQLLTFIFMLILLGRYNLWIALALVVVMIPQSLSYYRVQQEAFETMVTRSKNARKLDYYSDILLGRKDAKEVRLFSMFPAMIQNYISLFKSTRKKVDKIRVKQIYVSTFFLSLVVIVSGIGFFWFSNQVATGILSAGVLLMFISVIASLSNSLSVLVTDSSMLYDSLLWIKKYNKFQSYTDTFVDGKQKINEICNYEIKNLSFTYPFSKVEVLHNLNFEVKKGEKIAIVGENGSGKSTLIKLLMRFYDPDKGEILVDDINLKSLSISNYREKISATFQNFSKFKLSLLDNVSALRSKNKELVKSALQKAEFNKEVDLETILSKEFAGGIDLSGGQWQKVALARDFYSQAQVEFLDEPTAALDAKSENQVYQNFLKENSGKTIFFVTHRLSAVKYADKVLFLKQGKLSGFDTHGQLMKENKEYRDLYNLQKDAYL